MSHRARTALAVAGALGLLVAAIVGLAYILGGELGDDTQPNRAQRVSGLLAVGVLVPAGWLWLWNWQRRLRDEATLSTQEQLDAAADLLAERTFATWSQQVLQRGMQAPAPVRISWRWVKDLAPAPVEQAASSRSRKRLRKRQKLSASVVTRLHDKVYARLPHGRLVLIGSPGAGKTSAMILLLMEALRHREEQLSIRKRARTPVPVWLTLGSWDPRKKGDPSKPGHGLQSWVTKTIIRDHPYLIAKEFGPDAVPQLFEKRRIALFLDGLDEMPETLRAEAFLRLAEEAPGLRVVITSRPEEFRRTVEAGVQIPYTPVVELKPVAPKAAARYLLEGRIEATRQRWEDVANHLLGHPDGVLARTLNTPLTLTLARSAYKDRDPGGLLDFELADERSLRNHLLDEVLVAAYPQRGERDRASFWLGWLAYMMKTRIRGSIRDLRWWYIASWLPRRIPMLGGTLVVGLLVCLLVAVVGAVAAAFMIKLLVAVVSPIAEAPVGALVAAVKVGFVVTLASAILVGALIGVRLAGRGAFPRSMVFRWPTRHQLLHALGRGLPRGMGAALWVTIVGLFAVAFWIDLVWFPRAALIAPLVAPLVIGFVYWLIGAFLSLLDVWSVPLAGSTDATPNSIYRKDVQRQLVSGLVICISRTLTFGLISAVIGSLIAWPLVWLGSYAIFWLTGLWVGFPDAAIVLFWFGLAFWIELTLLVGVISGLAGGLGGGSAPLLLFSEVGLALRRERVRFMPLLEDALAKQVLRQAGAFYQFRHADLQDRLADQFEARLGSGRYSRYVKPGSEALPRPGDS